MSYEIELKARIAADDLDRLKDSLLSVPGMRYIGPTDKFDIYWSKTDDGDPLFRTRRQLTTKGPEVLFTAKPSKTKTVDGTEENQELEFYSPDRQWDNILTFFSGIGLQVCRLKWKKGFEYYVNVDGFNIHAELLDIRFLGWFLELEICFDSLDGVDKDAAERALRKLLSQVNVPESAIEPTGYNKMLIAIGHDKG